MDTTTDRPHHRTTSSSNNNNTSTSTSELFVCFTSRLSSSSMKLSSKSILSPSRSRDPPSLSTSLSRRLKSNGSMKGGQASPMFPTGGNGKRRGVGFENPEPSSPKVTCIGQVRVKTKKQGKKMRAATRSKRRGSEASFRKTEQPDLTRQNSQSFQHRNQRWVHLPLTICEALREFTCFFPCRSSCMSNEKEKGVVNGVEVGVGGGGGGERSGHGREDGSCGAAFQRWIVALQDGDGNGKGRGIELVMQEEDIIEGCENGGGEKTERSYSQRRHVFEDIDIDLVEGKTNEEMKEGEEEKGRVSICIPPKNALLLMRCRSDPVKMAALANRFWESPVHKDHYEEVQDEEEEDSGEEEEQEQEGEEEEDQHNEMEEDEEEQEVERVTKEEKKDCIFEIETEAGFVPSEEEAKSDAKESHEVETIKNTEESEEIPEEKEENEDEEGNGNGIQKDEIFSCESLSESHADLEKPETSETHLQEGEEKKENDESSELSSSPAMFTASELENDEAKAKAEESPEAEESVMAEAESESEGSTEKEEEEKGTEQSKQSRETEPTHDPNPDPESKERGNGSKLEERERQRLPECLLLMMCEPKLSMEVSKETWVCSTDFIRWLPERPTGKKDGAKVGTVDSSTKPKMKPKLPPQPPMQPPRSSCSFPATSGGAGMSMATMIEQKLVGSKSGNGYEPFVLTRCKSEPMRSAAKLAPDACFWNNRKLEPHPPPAPLGVGAPAGVGF